MESQAEEGQLPEGSVGDAGSPVVSVIIPARNAEATLERTLAAVRAQEMQHRFEIIVVDDGSSDATPEIAARHEPLVKLIRNPSSQGPGSARNRGVEAARAGALAFTDADCFPTPQWLARGLAALTDNDLVQGAVIPDPQAPRAPFDRTLVVDRPSGFYQTANLFVRRDVFESVGGFRDWSLDRPAWGREATRRRRKLPKHAPSGEDALFAWTARRMGATSSFASDIVVQHAVFPNTIREAIAYRWHWTRDMPGLARLVPELRDVKFHRHWFFASWTMRFDLAVAGLAAATLTRERRWLVFAAPYANWLARTSRRWGPKGAVYFGLGAPAVDAATLAGFIVGSVSWRCLVL